jgi:ribosomal protein S18 acetylase RimI-like enzyme
MRSASDIDPAALCQAFNVAFADYLTAPPNLKLEDWPLFLRRQGVDLGRSRVMTAGDVVCAFALICPIDPARERVATMGAIPSARGSGAAPRLLDHALVQARARGVATLELEVFAQNARALALYRSRGFEPIAELHGYERAPGSPASAPPAPPQEVTPGEAVAWLRALAIGGLPFQVSAAAIAASPGPLVAWRSGAAQLVFSPRDASNVAVMSLVDPAPQQAGANALARALAHAYPQATLRVPQLQRPDLGGRALESLGWARRPLHQLLMRRASSSIHRPQHRSER